MANGHIAISGCRTSSKSLFLNVPAAMDVPWSILLCLQLN